jgi:hypothetical protein
MNCRLRGVKFGRHATSVAGALMVFLSSPPSTGSPDGNSAKEGKPPVAWGVLSGNSGCVIFAESRKTQVRFVGVFLVTRPGQLDVLETQNYDMTQKQWKETREALQDLQKLGLANRLKFVKIPEKHTGRQLEAARALCKEPSAPPSPSSGG